MVRLDRLPMDQVALARGGAALYAGYERDPDYVHEWRRRVGSVRQTRYAAALGVACPGRAARLQMSRTLAGAAGFTVIMSVLTGDLAEINFAYPILTLRASRTAATLNDSFQVYLKRTALSTYRLCIKTTNTAAATVNDETFAVTANTGYSLAVRWNGTTFSITDNTTTKSLAPVGTFTGPYYVDFAGDKYAVDKPKGSHPAVANIGVRATYTDPVPTNLGARSAGLSDYYWKLDGADGGSLLVANTGAALLLGYPAAPQLAATALQFSSESGALQIEHSTDMDRFWQTILKAVGQESLTFYLKGTRGLESAQAVTLLDYGDLMKVEILATNFVRLTYNGTTLTDVTTQITSGVAFEIFAGRDGVNLALQVASTASSVAAPQVPFLDFKRILNIYVGADEDPALDTHYMGSLTRLALWPFATQRDAGADLASFYFDFTGDEIKDSSLSAVPAIPMFHTDEAGEPMFMPGPLSDAAHVSVEGGEVVAHSGPLLFDNALRKRMGSDTASVRVGERSFVSSGDRAHIVNHKLSRTRPLGLPKPGADVTTQAVGTGALDGAYAYGYQFGSHDGTLGPLKRLQPVSATRGARVILGSSDGAENEAGSELDETFGRNYETGDVKALDRFKMAWDAGAPTAGTYTTEVRARLNAITKDDLKEKVHHRGVTANDGTYFGDTLYFSTDIPTHSFNINGNWTVQTVFEFHKAKDSAGPLSGWGLWGVGKTERLTGAATFPSYNQDFCAFFLDGSNDAGGEVSDYYTGELGRDHYGDGARPRLVVMWPRQEHRESWYFTGRILAFNYAPLTFTDATEPTWAEGSTYDIIFQRSGQALTVMYRNLTAGDTTYTTLASRTMAALATGTSGSGKTVPAKASYTSTDFFTGYKPLADARDFHFGTAEDYHLSDVPFFGGTTTTGVVDGNADPAIGQIDQANYTTYITGVDYDVTDTNKNQVKAAPGGTTGWKPMHFRVWNRVVSTPDLERDALFRSAALVGEPLNYGIFIDLGCVIEVETANTDKLTDKGSGMIWFAKNEQGTGASRSPSAETLAFAEPTTASLVAPRYPLAMFGTVTQSFANADLKLYVSPFGDGSYTLQSRSTGAFNLRKRIWSALTSDPLTTKLISDFPTFVNDFDEFKWFSFGLVLATNGANRNIGADSLAINGNTLFKATIGGTSSETITAAHFSDALGWISLAGFHDQATDPTWVTDVSEFRVWKPGFGPDVKEGEDFDYVLGRVSENEYANMSVYIKFQPEDETAPNIKNFGTQTTSLIEIANADIVDTRTTVGGGSDPAPKVAFPGAPFEDVTFLQISRSAGVPVVDPEKDADVQTALNAVRGAPLYLLARIPAGSTHYVDAAPDGALGYGVDADVGQVPQVITSVFSWQNHIGLTTGDFDLWFSEAGPFGFETFPNWLRHRVPVATGGGPVVAAREAGGLLFIFGREWLVVASGRPTSPTFTTVGAGCGTYGPRTVTAFGGVCFTYNGTLWAVGDGLPVNIGLPVQDLLPAAANARLCTSSALASLFLIDETTGVALRYHFPTQRWSVEERDAIACGDLDSGEDAWVTRDGATASGGNAAVYGDDVNTTTVASATGTVSGDTVVLTTATVTVPEGTRTTVTQADGTSVEARIVSVAGAPSTITYGAGALTGVLGTVKVRFGAGPTGLLIDSGPLDYGTQDYRHALNIPVHLLQSDEWEIGRLGLAMPGDPADRASLAYTAVLVTDERLGDGSLLGRFQRFTLRNRVPEASRCTFFET